ncbi:MAG TPA: hypothetical protein VFS43_45595 [Polyangiaceae bacterium]|nr:hypothetical protein [Polyangiaceae bacterium]
MITQKGGRGAGAPGSGRRAGAPPDRAARAADGPDRAAPAAAPPDRAPGAALLVAALLGALAGGCGGGEPPAPPPPPPADDPSARRPKAETELPAVEQEVGGLNEHDTTRAFSRLMPKLERCQQEGRTRDERLDFLSGDIELEVHVQRDGGARRAFLSRSTLGDREAEKCIVAAARAAAWPRAEGGEAVAKNAFQLPLRAERDALAWDDTKVASAVKKAARAFRACRRGNRARFEVTAYVDRDGSVISAGVASPGGEADAAAECMVKAAKGLKLPSPGDWPAKVTFAAP